MGLEYGPKNGDTNFNMKKVCVKAVQKNMSEVQNYARKQVCSQHSEKNEDGETFCNTMLTCHETWLFQHNLKTWHPSVQRETLASPQRRKA